jgi:hypothetical protein
MSFDFANGVQKVSATADRARLGISSECSDLSRGKTGCDAPLGVQLTKMDAVPSLWPLEYRVLYSAKPVPDVAIIALSGQSRGFNVAWASLYLSYTQEEHCRSPSRPIERKFPKGRTVDITFEHPTRKHPSSSSQHRPSFANLSTTTVQLDLAVPVSTACSTVIYTATDNVTSGHLRYEETSR